LAALVAATPSGSSARVSLYFQHASTFDVIEGNGSGVAEIVDASRDGKQLVYTDGDNDSIGFVNIANPLKPQGQGTLDVGGEPTSLVVRNNLVLVGVNTSESFTEPSGQLVVANRKTRRIVATYELGGQPDSLAMSPDRSKAAIVLENERDEDLDDGLLPQLPSGQLLIVDLSGPATGWTISEADLSPVAANAANGDDLEPEYVDINRQNLAVVTFQENNHLAVVDLETGETVADFSAGSAELSNVDTEEEDLINLDSDITKRREPDAVTWIDADSFATANEGDYEDEHGEEGGSRGFTIFNIDGTVEYESAESFEHQLVSVGHYNEGRSENKGVEPESVEYGKFRGRDYLFVGSERSNAVGVYELGDDGPEYLQVLPTGIGPEGLKAIGKRGLFIVSTEADEAGDGIPTMINIYRIRTRTAPTYPMIESADDENGLPIPWVALSGLAADPTDAKTLYAVNDSFLAAGFVYEVDVTNKPATIVDRTEVTGASADLDLEGVAVGSDGSWWLASEGNSSSRPNLILKVDPATGAVMSEIELPADLTDERRGNGFEGLAVTGEPGAEVVYVAIQRAWPDEGDTDEVNTKIGRYDVATGTWGFVHYLLEPEGNGDWVGLSAMEPLPNGEFAVIERDKGWGPSTGFNAELKSIYVVDLANADFRAFDDPAGLATVDKTLAYDLLRRLSNASIWTTEKVEGLAVATDGQVYVVTDNDGVDDAPGETVFLRLGKLKARFR
jgi:uncharacterized protein YjiK